jgi:hypothetical protein
MGFHLETAHGPSDQSLHGPDLKLALGGQMKPSFRSILLLFHGARVTVFVTKPGGNIPFFFEASFLEICWILASNPSQPSNNRSDGPDLTRAIFHLAFSWTFLDFFGTGTFWWLAHTNLKSLLVITHCA